MEWFTSPSCPLTQKWLRRPYKSILANHVDFGAVCRELKCHFPHVPFHRSRRCPVTDHVRRTRLIGCSLNKWHAFPHGSVLAFRNKFWSNTQRIKPVRQRKMMFDRFLQTASDRSGRMLQDMLNSVSTQSAAWEWEARRFSSLRLKNASDHLKYHDRGLEVEQMDKATTQALPHSQGIHYVRVLTFHLHILYLKYSRNGLGRKCHGEMFRATGSHFHSMLNVLFFLLP